jgi:hypothetical protein
MYWLMNTESGFCLIALVVIVVYIFIMRRII